MEHDPSSSRRPDPSAEAPDGAEPRADGTEDTGEVVPAPSGGPAPDAVADAARRHVRAWVALAGALTLLVAAILVVVPSRPPRECAPRLAWAAIVRLGDDPAVAGTGWRADVTHVLSARVTGRTALVEDITWRQVSAGGWAERRAAGPGDGPVEETVVSGGRAWVSTGGRAWEEVDPPLAPGDRIGRMLPDDVAWASAGRADACTFEGSSAIDPEWSGRLIVDAALWPASLDLRTDHLGADPVRSVEMWRMVFSRGPLEIGAPA